MIKKQSKRFTSDSMKNHVKYSARERFLFIAVLFIFFHIAIRASSIQYQNGSENIPDQYYTKIYLMNGPVLEGFLVFCSTDHLVIACTSCVDEGIIPPELTIPSDRIKKIHQKVKETDYNTGNENSGSCLDPYDANCPEGCIALANPEPRACLITAGIGLIVAAIVAIAYEHNRWDRFPIHGDEEEYKKILFHLRVYQRPPVDKPGEKPKYQPGILLHPKNI
jgi:hypothetical protein